MLDAAVRLTLMSAAAAAVGQRWSDIRLPLTSALCLQFFQI